MGKYAEKIKMIIIKVLFFYSLFIGIMYYMQRSMMYVPTKEQYSLSKYNLDDFKYFEVETEDKLKIKALYKPAIDNKPIIIFFHGNSGHVAHREYKIRPLVDAGYGMLLAEYRGYGLNEGKPTEENLYNDARAYIEKLDTDNIILYGESLGTGIATQMATEYKIKALILEIPFDSILNVAKKTYFFIPFLDYLMHDKYENDKKISSIEVPKLFIIAGKDEVVGAEGGIRLSELADDNKQLIIIEEATHNSMHLHNIPPKILSFISDL